MADSSSSSTVEAPAATGGSSSTLQGERRPAASSLVKVQSDDAESSLYEFRLWLWTTLDVPSSSWYAQILSAFLMVTIAASILNFSIGSYPQDYCGYDESSGSPVRVCSSKRLEDYPWSSQLETACIAVFTVEYVLRLLTCTTVMSVGRFICDAPNVIDLIAILPWYFILIMTEIARASGSGQNATQGKIFGVVRIVRLTRILRVLKVSKSMKMMMVLGRTMVRSTTILLLLLLLVFIMVSPICNGRCCRRVTASARGLDNRPSPCLLRASERERERERADGVPTNTPPTQLLPADACNHALCGASTSCSPLMFPCVPVCADALLWCLYMDRRAGRL